MTPFRLFTLTSVIALSACSSGGDSGYCSGSFHGGDLTSSVVACTGCSVGMTPDAIDDSSSSAAVLTFPASGGQITVRATARGDDTFPAGTRPGALMKFPEVNLVNSGVSFVLYNDEVVVATANGGASAGNGNVPGAGSKTYYERDSAVEFDAVEAQVTVSGSAETVEVLVYEVCGDN